RLLLLLLLLRRQLCLLPLLLEIGEAEEILPDEQHQPGEHDRKQHVLVVVHCALFSSAEARPLVCPLVCRRRLRPWSAASPPSNAAIDPAHGREGARLRAAASRA